MAYIDAFRAHAELIARLGEGNAHLVWAIGLFLEEPDLEALASEALTDGPDDKKVDFIHLDRDGKRIVFAQGYFSSTTREAAPANKASDLNTAAAWLLSGDLNRVPPTLRSAVEECRQALMDGDVESVELLYVHNLPESVNVNRELQTAAEHLKRSLGADPGVGVISRELGAQSIEHLFRSQDSHIEVRDEIPCPAHVLFQESGPNWKAAVLSVPGAWLHDLFKRYDQGLFSANYRGFLGITKRRKINTAIRSSAEGSPRDFWVFNNGITLLTMGMRQGKSETTLSGVSIINGAQTTGSIGSVDVGKHDLKQVRVLCRVIECSDPQKISDIVKYNNTQNEIMTWDQYSSDPEQERIQSELNALGHGYSRKRGFRRPDEEIGIEDVAQPLVAFHGRFEEANRGKNRIFERGPLYKLAFEGKKARHILLVHSLARAVDEIRIELKRKSNAGQIIGIEQQQLSLLRNLRFKNFLLAMLPRLLEATLGQRVDAETIGFSPQAARRDEHTIVALVAACVPFVKTVLSFVAAQVKSEGLADVLSHDDPVTEVASKVEAMLYASKEHLSLGALPSLLEGSGDAR